ncbi:MAG: tryptophan synthase subunit alpha [Candidatus Omnitrophota bacterium]|nr:tryptophan synthase subunit alpha [Candidatus Omnitrophota bacterium]
MNRIDQKFHALKKHNKKAFVAFITAGYPNLNITKKLVLEFAKIGVDIIELGVPFSDPMADGPIIQEASQTALKRGINLNDILNLVKMVRKDIGIPLCLMTYYNPIFCFGEERFVRKAAACGVDGIIIPDLPPEEGKSFIRLANKFDLDTIFFLSPTTTRERIKFVSGISRGFIYYVSLTGVTGPRQNLPKDLINNLKVIKKFTAKPVCVGFGVSSAEQAKAIYRIADGVIVGSVIIKKIRENIGKPDLVKKVGKFVSNLMT